MKKILFSLLIFFFAAGFARGDTFDGSYAVTENGKTAGTASYFLLGGNTIQGVYRDSAGMVKAQYRLDGKNYEQDMAPSGGAAPHYEAPLNNGPAPTVYFDGWSIFDFIPEANRFPQTPGIAETIHVVDLSPRQNLNAVMENRGFRLMRFNDRVLKLRYFLLDLNGAGMSLYFDRPGRLVMAEIPSKGRTFTLSDYAPSGFPMSDDERFNCGASGLADCEPVSIDGAGMAMVIKRKDAIHPPGILLIATEKDRRALTEPLADALASRGAMVLLVEPKPGNGEALRNGFRFLLHAPGIDSSRLAVIGSGDEAVAAGELAAHWGGALKALAVLSPDPAFFGDSESLRSAAASQVAVLVLQGANDSQSSVPDPSGFSGASFKREILPGLDANFFPATKISASADSADTQRTADSASLGAVEEWLTTVGIFR